MDFEEPRGCRITQMRLQADSEEAFTGAVEALGLDRHGTVGPIMSGDEAYEYDWASKNIGSLHVALEGPRRTMRVVRGA